MQKTMPTNTQRHKKNCPTAWDISGEASHPDAEASYPDAEASYPDAEASHPEGKPSRSGG